MKSDSFDKVLGSLRGPSAAELREQLDAAERKLAEAETVLAGLEAENEELDGAVNRARKREDDFLALLEHQRESLRLAHWERDRARYATLRAGGPDPVLGSELEQHHGRFSPGRPYLAGTHCYHPRTGQCYRTGAEGAPVGHEPGHSPFWTRCSTPVTCPKPPSISQTPHPVATHFALRQQDDWWDKEHRRWRLCDMTDAYLEAVIAWLEEHKEFLWSTELQAVPQLVPGPAIAYEGPDDWLEDQFLMRSLRAEHQRRVHAHEEAT